MQLPVFVPPEGKTRAKIKKKTKNKYDEFPQNIKPDVVIVCCSSVCVTTFGRVVISTHAM